MVIGDASLVMFIQCAFFHQMSGVEWTSVQFRTTIIFFAFQQMIRHSSVWYNMLWIVWTKNGIVFTIIHFGLVFAGAAKLLSKNVFTCNKIDAKFKLNYKYFSPLTTKLNKLRRCRMIILDGSVIVVQSCNGNCVVINVIETKVRMQIKCWLCVLIPNEYSNIWKEISSSMFRCQVMRCSRFVLERFGKWNSFIWIKDVLRIRHFGIFCDFRFVRPDETIAEFAYEVDTHWKGGQINTRSYSQK